MSSDNSEGISHVCPMICNNFIKASETHGGAFNQTIFASREIFCHSLWVQSQGTGPNLSLQSPVSLMALWLWIFLKIFLTPGQAEERMELRKKKILGGKSSAFDLFNKGLNKDVENEHKKFR